MKGKAYNLFSAADGGTSEYTYQWSSIPEGFSSDEQNPTVTPTEPTTYIVAVNDGEIIMTDSVNITVFANPQIDLGPDQVLCGVNEYVLDAGNQGSTYLWSTGDTTQSLVASGSGETMFWVEVTNESGCSKQDTVYLNFAAKPEVNLGNDTTVCQNETFTLNAGNPGSSYLWSTGATTQTIDVSGEGETMYWVNVTNEASCSQNDTIYVDFIAAPVVDLGNDTIVCQTGTITLNAGNSGSSYQWSTGQTTQSVTLNASDFPVGMQTISVEVTNGAGCMSSADKLVEIRDCTGIDEFSAASLEVFPNPGSGIFNLKLDNLGNQTITVKVISITGNIVYQNQHNVNSTFKQQINLSDASEGIYTVVVEGKDLLINKKVVIRR